VPATSGTLSLLAGCVALALAIAPRPAAAQASPAPVPAEPETEAEATAEAASQSDEGAVDDSEAPTTSSEQGQTSMDESFGPKSRRDWIRETRRKAFEDTKFDVQARSYYLDRTKYDDSESEAWAVGGSAGFKTGYFRDRWAFGATGYTSQPLHAPDDKDGTLLLQSGQEGYAVIGEAYGEFLINEDSKISFGRRALDTPYINRNDSRMTPNTFEAITFHGLYGGDGKAEWRVGGGYIDEIKERTAENFVSMAQDAGAPDGVDEGVYAAGVNYKLGDLSIGAIDYYSPDIINIFYTEAKYAWAFGNDMKLGLAGQFTDQTSVGDELLRGTDFQSQQWGAKADLTYKRGLFSFAYTSASGDTDMQGPWSGYPGYTSVQVEDFNRDGEDAWMLRAAYNFASLKGASIYGLYVNGSDPDSPSAYAKNEYDLNFQWTVAEGSFGGLMVRLRYAHISQDDPLQTDQDDVRVMLYYDPPKL
jgi:hypothetical protein